MKDQRQCKGKNVLVFSIVFCKGLISKEVSEELNTALSARGPSVGPGYRPRRLAEVFRVKG
jgi:hypothetical protein